MDPQSVARQALQDGQRLKEYTQGKMIAWNGKVCNGLQDLKRDTESRFQMILQANQHLQTNMARHVPEHEAERSLYFQLRRERDAELYAAWMAYFAWQEASCQGRTAWFSDPVAEQKEHWRRRMEGLEKSVLSMRLALFRFLSRLTLEERKTVLYNR
ncbi:MAG: hypothetical protein KDK25_13680 [Leptospiraceae bacterium]|nr:hypothetical protein [Leptospiraceae bacterium]MCB1171390.1 hypothetical protein [Leptospiraceae bacterium]